MIVSAIIPARYASSRFPGKPLAKILGKPMIQHVYESVLKSGIFDQIWVATDHLEILECVASFKGKAMMTRTDHPSGTDRVWEVAAQIGADAVVNIQGDEPLLDQAVLQKIHRCLVAKEPVVTAAFNSKDWDSFASPDHVKVVVDNNGYALYFSRAAIPACRGESFVGFWHHIGIYGYQMDVLRRFVALPPSFLEKTESLEQLRLLENGIRIKVVETDHVGFGVDKAEDIFLVEDVLKKRSFIYG